MCPSSRLALRPARAETAGARSGPTSSAATAGRRPLDIGCSDGEYLELAGKAGERPRRRDWSGYTSSYEQLFSFEAATLTRMLESAGFHVDDVIAPDPGDWSMSHRSQNGHILLVSAQT